MIDIDMYSRPRHIIRKALLLPLDRRLCLYLRRMDSFILARNLYLSNEFLLMDDAAEWAEINRDDARSWLSLAEPESAQQDAIAFTCLFQERFPAKAVENCSDFGSGF